MIPFAYLHAYVDEGIAPRRFMMDCHGLLTCKSGQIHQIQQVHVLIIFEN